MQNIQIEEDEFINKEWEKILHDGGPEGGLTPEKIKLKKEQIN